MIIKAKFTGINSLGYETGQEYTLILADKQGISVQRIGGSGKCPYDSLSAFLSNWDNIRKVDVPNTDSVKAGEVKVPREYTEEMNKKILYIDMDNVLVDFQSGIDAYDKIDEYVTWASGPERSAVEKKSFKYINWEGRWDENPTIFRLMKPMPGAVEAFEKLSQQFDTYILSTAPWNNPEAWKEKRKWVEKYLGEAAYKRLILSHHKNLMRGDYLIDDRLANGADRFEGTHIHFGTERFPDWKAVMEYMEEMRCDFAGSLHEQFYKNEE